jgi:hypothetical protein
LQNYQRQRLICRYHDGRAADKPYFTIERDLESYAGTNRTKNSICEKCTKERKERKGTLRKDKKEAVRCKV